MDDDCLLTWLFPSEGPADENTFHYGPLTLSMASRQGKAITLLADQVFNPALVFAEQIDLGIIQVADKTGMASVLSALTLYVVCELGAGTGLPGLYAFINGARKVVLTDYPDDNILGCLWQNVKRNLPEQNIKGKVVKEGDRWCTVAGHDWGTDTQNLKR